jgi:phosphoglycolate phosphatase
MTELVIFDLDGTLLYTIEDLRDSVNFALKQYDMPTVSLEATTANVGNGVKNLISLCAPDGTDEQTLDEILSAFKEHYKGNMENKTRPYDGVAEMLIKLKEKGIKTAVLSNKFDAATVRLCNNLMPDLIDLPVGERADFPRKPSPEAVYDIIERLGMKCENTVFVGDSDTDIKTGKNAGVKTVAVTWGYRNRKLLEESFADYMADTVDELCEILINKI